MDIGDIMDIWDIRDFGGIRYFGDIIGILETLVTMETLGALETLGTRDIGYIGEAKKGKTKSSSWIGMYNDHFVFHPRLMHLPCACTLYGAHTHVSRKW